MTRSDKTTITMKLDEIIKQAKKERLGKIKHRKQLEAIEGEIAQLESERRELRLLMRETEGMVPDWQIKLIEYIETEVSK